MFSLEQLRGFVAVAEHLHFGRAAQELQMTQPPLSRQIQKLETDLGAQLFDRSNRSVALTPVGELLLDRARQLLALAERSREAVRSAARGDEGSLTVGFTAASSISVLGPLLARFREHIPRIEIDLRERVTNQQLAEIERGAIDLGLVRNAPRQDPAMQARELFVEHLAAALPAGHPLADDEGPIRLDDLAAHPMIGYARPDSEYFVRKTQALLGARDVQVAFQVSQILSLLALVGMGLGFGLVPRSAEHMRVDGVVIRELDLDPGDAAHARVSIHAVWSRDSRNPALWRALEALGSSPLNVS
ncbi:LysR family transcriptional regulator [Microbacterium sp. Marseille-Q6965]|uniref:LysR family transcriptional regulator n=1 Tax=Microbacterium sp. Marseille-Q6965 TaxID=2965072 RepID=UPI0021B7802F|nr:LysR substrate-binding domain-containing protein [Microbacterium sp. Marseille-Q6965]